MALQMLNHQGVNYQSYISHLLILDFWKVTLAFFHCLKCYQDYNNDLIIITSITITTVSITVVLKRKAHFPSNSRNGEMRVSHYWQTSYWLSTVKSSVCNKIHKNKNMGTLCSTQIDGLIFIIAFRIFIRTSAYIGTLFIIVK